MALFESYERRIDKINGVLAKYGIGSIEECREIIADEANLSKGGARKRATRTRSTARKTTAKK